MPGLPRHLMQELKAGTLTRMLGSFYDLVTRLKGMWFVSSIVCLLMGLSYSADIYFLH